MNNLPPISKQPPASRRVAPQASSEPFDQDLYSSDRTIAKYCYAVKQHFAKDSLDTYFMSGEPINDVLASNLARLMAERGLSQKDLSGKSGVAQTTISLYLRPASRKDGASGKKPSAKLSEVEMLANGLNVEVWELLQQPKAKEAWPFLSVTPDQYAAIPKAKRDILEITAKAFINTGDPPESKHGVSERPPKGAKAA